MLYVFHLLLTFWILNPVSASIPRAFIDATELNRLIRSPRNFVSGDILKYRYIHEVTIENACAGEKRKGILLSHVAVKKEGEMLHLQNVLLPESCPRSNEDVSRLVRALKRDPKFELRHFSYSKEKVHVEGFGHVHVAAISIYQIIKAE